MDTEKLRYRILEPLFRGHEVRRTEDGWLIFRDVCAALGLTSLSKPSKRTLTDATKVVTIRYPKAKRRQGQRKHHRHRIISPVGALYFALTGRTEQAKAFHIWLSDHLNIEYFEIVTERRQFKGVRQLQ